MDHREFLEKFKKAQAHKSECIQRASKKGLNITMYSALTGAILLFSLFPLSGSPTLGLFVLLLVFFPGIIGICIGSRLAERKRKESIQKFEQDFPEESGIITEYEELMK